MEMAGEVGVKWRGRLLCVYAGGKDIEAVEDEPDNADIEEQRGCAWHRKVQGHHTTQPSTATVGEGFRRNYQEKSRTWLREEQRGVSHASKQWFGGWPCIRVHPMFYDCFRYYVADIFRIWLMPLWHLWGNLNIQDGRHEPEKYYNSHNCMTNPSRNVLYLPSYRLSHIRNMFRWHKMYGNPRWLPIWSPMTWKICYSHINVLLCVLASMFCPPNNKRGDISMANDVCKSKMAAKVATTNMKIIKITITSFYNSLRNVLLVYTHVLSPREYERICLNGKISSQIQDGYQYSQHKLEICWIDNTIFILFRSFRYTHGTNLLCILFLIRKMLNYIKGSCHYIHSCFGVPLKPSTINQ